MHRISFWRDWNKRERKQGYILHTVSTETVLFIIFFFLIRLNSEYPSPTHAFVGGPTLWYRSSSASFLQDKDRAVSYRHILIAKNGRSLPRKRRDQVEEERKKEKKDYSSGWLVVIGLLYSAIPAHKPIKRLRSSSFKITTIALSQSLLHVTATTVYRVVIAVLYNHHQHHHQHQHQQIPG